MTDRIISLLLIVAVIACPMWCASGACHRVGGCPDQDCCDVRCGPAAGDSLNVVAGECENSNRSIPRPTPCPEKEKCRGVCGGAVFEKPGELDGFAVSGPLADVRWIASTPEIRQSVNTELLFHYLSATNYGRFVRTLHASLLC